MRFKKFLAVVIVIFMLMISLVGCNALTWNNNNNDDNDNDNDNQQNNNENDEFSLSDIYAWIDDLKLEDIVKVRYERGSFSVTPGDFTDISYSTNSVDIQNTYARLFSKVTLLDDDFRLPFGGGYVKYVFYTKNDTTFSISMNTECVVTFNNQYYLVDSFIYKFQHSDLNCYSFTQPADTYLVCSAGDDYASYGEIYLGNLEFCEYDGYIDAEPSCRLMGNFVNLLVLSDNLFVIEGRSKVYQVVSEIDFSELFSDDDENEVSLSNIYTWIDDLKQEDIVRVRYEKCAIGVAPSVQPTVAFSTNSVDIQNTYALLSCELQLIKNYSNMDGGNYIKYTFYTSDGKTYSISISNSVVCFNDEYYMVKSFNYQFQYPESDDVGIEDKEEIYNFN